MSNVLAAVEAIRNADALLICAGAGMGVDSGLPDFRGNAGFWKAYPVVARLGLSFSELANPAWFKEDPHLAWAFYGHRLQLYRETKPHEGFAILQNWAKSKKDGYFVFTSNVDGQFQKAGFDAEQIVECHGSIHHCQCANYCRNDIWPAKDAAVRVDMTTFRAEDPLPQCPRCGGMARPNILMFNDFDWVHERSAEQQKRFVQWQRRLEGHAAKIAVIEMGAGAAIPSVRHESERMVKRPGRTLIRINPREPEVPAGQFGLAMGALAGIRELDEAMTG
ncbi:MAG TPA: Sir2 family NAD-dependent protein deacetylase [Candidatus Acidoferrales bacterium]|jgi:NAD-dependent SIR2 family protein deacetylase|nr:Sir2 family NAD-dependent protein deacetylase [Candidatus Acidoferrales bacterium]